MRDLVMRYLSHDLTRRSFLKSMAVAGFTLTAAESVLKSLTPLAEAQTIAPEAVRIMEGTGGELFGRDQARRGCDAGRQAVSLGCIGRAHRNFGRVDVVSESFRRGNEAEKSLSSPMKRLRRAAECERFFASRMVVAVGLEPTTSRM